MACRVTLLVGAIAALAAGCEEKAPAPAARRLTVLAAASLGDAFRELGSAFEATHKRVRVEFSFAGSNQLRTQLEEGAPGDVFASADRVQMDAAVSARVVEAKSVRAFAMNTLTVIVPRANRANIRSVADLARPGLKIVVADAGAPAGRYTQRMLEAAGAMAGLGPEFVKGFEANVVSREENVSAVAAKVAMDEADAGIAYVSDAAGSRGEKLTRVALPAELDQPAEYVAAATARAAEPALAREFIEFLASREGAAFLTRHGYVAPLAGMR